MHMFLPCERRSMCVGAAGPAKRVLCEECVFAGASAGAGSSATQERLDRIQQGGWDA